MDPAASLSLADDHAVGDISSAAWAGQFHGERGIAQGLPPPWFVDLTTARAGDMASEIGNRFCSSPHHLHKKRPFNYLAQ